MAAFRMGIPKRYPGDKRPKMVIERSVIFTPFIKNMRTGFETQMQPTFHISACKYSSVLYIQFEMV